MVTYVHATFFKLIFGKKFDHGLRAITKWRWWGWSDDDTVVKVSVLFVKSKHLKSTSTILSVCRIYSQCVLLWIHIHAFARRIFGAKTWRRHSNRSGCRRNGSPDSFHSPSCTNARGNVHCFESCSGTGGGKNVRASKLKIS